MSDFKPVYLNMKEIAEGFEQVAVDVFESRKQKVVSRWYQSGSEVHFYIWQDKKDNIIKQQMSICGQVVEWNVVEGVRTGVTVLEEIANSYETLPTEEVIYDSDLQGYSLNQAVFLIQESQILEDDLKTEVLNNFVSSPNVSSIPPEEFLLKYGENSGIAKKFLEFKSYLRSRFFPKKP